MDVEKAEIYHIDKEYLKYLHKIDYRVSVKFNNRPFVGIVTSIDDKKYVFPLTSQTTQNRVADGKKKRSPLITTFVTETSGTEIANLLYNNMIPITDELITKAVIDPKCDTYELNEIRYIRKNWDAIKTKAKKVYDLRNDKASNHYQFLLKTCCDFKKLETAMADYSK
jgi:hypothetical protein